MAKDKSPTSQQGKASTGKPAPAKANVSPAKLTKKTAKTSPSKDTTTSSSSNAMNVYVCSTMSDDLILLLEKLNGTPPFWHPTAQYLNTNADFRRHNLHIDQIHQRNDPDNPDQYRSMATNQGRSRTYPVLVNILVETAREANTSANRAAWANHFVAFFNHPSNQNLFTYPVQAHYAGDLTPTNSATAPHLSDFLTVRDTMEVMREAFMETGATDLAPIGDILEKQDAMAFYYTPAALERANIIFLANRNHAPGGAERPGAQNYAADGDFQDLPNFAF